MSPWTVFGLCLFCYALGVMARSVDPGEDVAAKTAVISFIVAIVIFVVRITLFFNERAIP